jgi:hypothetical protein
VEKKLIDGERGTGWVFLVEYGTGGVVGGEGGKNAPNESRRIDYREVLSPEEYALYDKLRNQRKEIADKAGIPVYAVFTNDQLAGMVKKPPKTAKDLLSISGIGESRVKQYGEAVISFFSNEAQTLIDSYETLPGRGVPIGNLTSQFFANMYLAFLDHYILEILRPPAYCRYMDDFVLWSASKEQLKDMYAKINDYVKENLNLTLKTPVFGSSAIGLPFLGFLIKEKGIYLMRKSKRRVAGRMSEITVSLCQGSITEEKAAERVRSVFAGIDLARTKRFRKKLCEKGERLLALTV